jgi:hypothetical protein
MTHRRFSNCTRGNPPPRSKRLESLAKVTSLAIACGLATIPPVLSAAEKPDAGDSSGAASGKVETPASVSPELQAALGKLAMPGVKINVAEWCVDVDASVCLLEGTLELIACTKNTKEHESVIAVDAKPSHIHTALLLLRAKPGQPATHKALDPEGTQFIPVPPSGGPVDVFLVIKDDQGKVREHPISEFIKAAGQTDEAEEDAESAKFPTHTFLFAGSYLGGAAGETRTYACDSSGNVISLATFGDELLCLPGIHEHADSLRMWQVDGDKLPARDTKVTLRLRPQVKPAETKAKE